MKFKNTLVMNFEVVSIKKLKEFTNKIIIPKVGEILFSHGKKWPLMKMSKNDIIFIYSPKTSLESPTNYQKITACGTISDDIVYSYKMFEGFNPYRRNVKYISISELSLMELNKIEHWLKYKHKIRYGFFEIDKDFAKSLYIRLTK